MFDGTLTTTPDETGELARLRSIYDGLLLQPPVPPGDDALADLAAMANIFDLDARRPPAAVWGDLRAVLMGQAVAGAAAATDLPDVAPLTLMVVEDDPDMAASLTELLTGAGHRVVGPFPDARAATAAAALHAVDLALLDINLAGDGAGEGSGVALARALKQTWGVPVIFLSGDIATAARNAALATALVHKPYTGRDVLDGIARAVAAGAVPG
jgi:CheY-like chemotaxis protein